MITPTLNFANCIISQLCSILMGTPEEEIFVDPSEKTDLPDIIDDFDLDFNAGSEEVGSCSFFSIAMDIIHIRYVCK